MTSVAAVAVSTTSSTAICADTVAIELRMRPRGVRSAKRVTPFVMVPAQRPGNFAQRSVTHDPEPKLQRQVNQKQGGNAVDQKLRRFIVHQAIPTTICWTNLYAMSEAKT